MTTRLGLIGYALERATGGIGRYSRELIGALQGLDLNITVLRAGVGEIPDFMARTQVLRSAARLPGLLTLGQVEIARIARKDHLDIIHDPTGALPLTLAQTRRVATIHDVIPYIFPRTSTTLDWFLYHAWLPVATRSLDAVITISQQSKEDLIKHMHLRENQIEIIPDGVSRKYHPMREAEFSPALERAGISRPYILYVGSIEPRKNLNRLLQAFAGLRQWLDKWTLVIVGARNYWKSSPVIQVVEQLGLTDKVIFTGFIQEDDLPSIYNGADCFIFPSLYEGFGLPVLEAMACGTPVITSNSSSLPEVAGDAGILVDPNQVEAITSAMRQVLSDPDLAAELRQRGLARAAGFTWERTARETVAVYKSVLSRSR